MRPLDRDGDDDAKSGTFREACREQLLYQLARSASAESEPGARRRPAARSDEEPPASSRNLACDMAVGHLPPAAGFRMSLS